MHEPESENSASKPEDGREEDECSVGLPLLAGALVSDVGPVEDGTAVKGSDELRNVSFEHCD